MTFFISSLGLEYFYLIGFLIIAVGVIVVMFGSVVYTAIHLAKDLGEEIYEWIRRKK